MGRTLLLTVLLAVSLAASARERELPMRTLYETESLFLSVPGTENVRISNNAVLSAVCREKRDIELRGLRIGEAMVTLVDTQGEQTRLSVRVLPAYSEMLTRLFADDPEISVEVVGDRVVLSGATANVEVLRRVRQAQAFDAERIVSQVSYSPEALKVLLADFLQRNGQTGIVADLVGHEVCLSGQMYDKGQIEALGARVKAFLSEFSGISVNTDGLRVYRQKILIGIEFLSYDMGRAHNLGVELSDTLGGKAELTFTLHESLSGTVSDAGNLSAQINTLKQNQVAKKLYATTLSTQSGEEAEFQSGGTLYKETSDLYKTGITEIEYGYIIKAKPTILDGDTVNLDFNLDLRTPVSDSKGNSDTDVTRYQTKSKYIVRPGESILLSGFNHWTEDEAKRGLPFLSRIPFIGALFGNESAGKTSNEMLLVVSVNWAIDDSEGVRAKADALRAKPVTVSMP